MYRIVTLTGKSGSGKTTIVDGVRRQIKRVELILSTTTREPRSSDLPREYEHITPFEFETLDRLERLAWKRKVADHSYGTKKSDIEKFLQQDGLIGIMILLPDVIPILREMGGDKILNLFVLSPGEEVLKKRMQERGDSEENITKRLQNERNWEADARTMGEFHFIDNRGNTPHFAIADVFQLIMQSLMPKS